MRPVNGREIPRLKCDLAHFIEPVVRGMLNALSSLDAHLAATLRVAAFLLRIARDGRRIDGVTIAHSTSCSAPPHHNGSATVSAQRGVLFARAHEMPAIRSEHPHVTAAA